MRRVKHILSYVLVLSMCFTLFFIPKYIVNADSMYGYSFSVGTVIEGFLPSASSNSKMQIIITKGSGVFYTFSVDNKSGIGAIFYSNSSFEYDYKQFDPDGTVTSSIHRVSDSNNETGLNRRYSALSYTLNSSHDAYIQPASLGDFQSINDAVNFFNSKALDDVNVSYGRVADVEYATRIAGSGLASADNIDRIVWNQSVDSNGNDLPIGARVQIRAIPGKYVGNTANELLTKTYTDFILDHSKQLIIVDIIASRGVYETKWSEVVDHFGFFPYSWVPNIQYIDNEYFKMGWIYQIRLQIDTYYSDWQNIYTATGSGASESQNITDSDDLTQQLVQDINIVNQLNNTTNTNWYINDTTINNSEYTENTNGKPWWAYLLEAILSLFQIGDGEQQTINNTNNLNIDLNDKLNEYNEIEDQQLNNLDTNLEAIEVESDMLENNKFVGSANWVAQQYTRMTNGTVIGSLIGFSLLFGLALIFIGKIR